MMRDNFPFTRTSFDLACRRVLARYERRFGKGHKNVDLSWVKQHIYHKGTAHHVRARFGRT